MTTDTMRPNSLSEYIGQTHTINELKVRAQAAKTQGRTLDHVLLCGPTGSGKTSLAILIAILMNGEYLEYTMPITPKIMQTAVGMFPINPNKPGILFLDEIHRLTPKQQEDLMPLIEFGYLQGTNGKKIESRNLTIIGATTEPQKMIAPLWDKFPIKPSWEPYTDEEMAKIVVGMARKSSVIVSEDDAMVLGKAACGIPRKVRQFILAMRDITATSTHNATATEALLFCRTEVDGLTTQHLNYLQTLQKLGGTSGLKLMSNLLSLNESVIVDLERLLYQNGLVEPTSSGRTLTTEGMRRIRTYQQEAVA